MTRTTPRRSAALSILATVVALAGCESMSEREKGTAQGAAIGAAAGALIGAATGGSAGQSAVIGGVVGAVAGNLWSKNMEDKRKAMEAATAGTGIEVARTQDNQLQVNVPSDLSFDIGRADIKPALRPVLDQFAQGLDPKMRVRIVGHTDSTGNDAINDPLSVQRATSVRNYLSNRGVDPARTEVQGRGSREPVADNTTEAGRAMNRRVEIFLSEPAA
ncbi:MAG: OmpA family protein [Rubrivivax sp.]|jgi:outer membrane protein OmpA-like peptidoglycan-associated protein|nr:OmpA family protein [Betaproteobacteria bacterium]MBP6318472.1 OmpA family protein [Rubrivivax sp.]MBK7278373.1 OmpA family protein [Betaproteobacteria bacterium]MBK7460180.1 OmpA family protein [Betaproteobacteria bacterium]MBK7515125.1 OmpA family protein [Betaproteobacteria bacterium]